jgi:hypothetical protein
LRFPSRAALLVDVDLTVDGRHSTTIAPPDCLPKAAVIDFPDLELSLYCSSKLSRRRRCFFRGLLSQLQMRLFENQRKAALLRKQMEATRQQ